MNTNKKTLTLLIHTNVAFEWCKSIVAQLSRQSIKRGFSLNIVYRYEDIVSSGGPVILLGVDRLWITENLRRLEESGHKVILLSGVVEKISSNISRIIVDHDDLIQKNVSHLRQCGRTKLAFFGGQKNDTSDNNKAESFSKLFSAGRIYNITENIEECFCRLSGHLHEYDGIICANDIIAVYLLKRCKELGISVPEQLSIVGNGNLWITANTTPSITTVSVDVSKIVAVILNICKSFYQYEEIASVDVYMKSFMIPRASTGYANFEADSTEYMKAPRLIYESSNTDKELIAIQQIDRIMSSLSHDKLQLLERYLKGETYDSIASQMYVSEETLRYHIKKIYKALGVHSKKECTMLLKQYLGG